MTMCYADDIPRGNSAGIEEPYSADGIVSNRTIRDQWEGRVASDSGIIGAAGDASTILNDAISHYAPRSVRGVIGSAGIAKKNVPPVAGFGRYRVARKDNHLAAGADGAQRAAYLQGIAAAVELHCHAGVDDKGSAALYKNISRNGVRASRKRPLGITRNRAADISLGKGYR